MTTRLVVRVTHDELLVRTFDTDGTMVASRSLPWTSRGLFSLALMQIGLELLLDKWTFETLKRLSGGDEWTLTLHEPDASGTGAAVFAGSTPKTLNGGNAKPMTSQCKPEPKASWT